MSRRSPEKQKPLIHLSHMRYADIPAVSQIEFASFKEPWPIQALEHSIDGAYQVSFVAVYESEVAGYAFGEISTYSTQITKLAVAPHLRRKRIATTLINNFIMRLGTKPYMSLNAEVREGNLEAQLLFKSLGFFCVSTLNNHFNDGETAYVFQYRVGDLARRRAALRG